MHALSRDADFYQKPCIYCQLDEPEDLAASQDEDVVCSHEMMLVPADESAGAYSAHAHVSCNRRRMRTELSLTMSCVI